MEIGIFVDIYPVDKYGNSIEECQKLYTKISNINKQYHIYINGHSYSNKFKNIFKMVYHYYLKITHLNFKHKVNKKIDAIIFENNKRDTELMGIPTWEPFCNPMKKEYFDEIIECEFENHLFYIPKEYHKILEQDYGNYMELPPIEKRVPHHFYHIYRK